MPATLYLTQLANNASILQSYGHMLKGHNSHNEFHAKKYTQNYNVQELQRDRDKKSVIKHIKIEESVSYTAQHIQKCADLGIQNKTST